MKKLIALVLMVVVLILVSFGPMVISPNIPWWYGFIVIGGASIVVLFAVLIAWLLS